MRSAPTAPSATRYADAKHELAEPARDDRAAYTEAKAAFVGPRSPPPAGGARLRGCRDWRPRVDDHRGTAATNRRAPGHQLLNEEETRWPLPRRPSTGSAPPVSPSSTPRSPALLERELDRQRGQIELIARENFTWPSVLEAVSSTPTNKYAEGYPGKRYYGGCEVVDELEQLAIDRAKELFGAEHANVQPHAGAMTNTAVYLAALEPGDTILSLSLAHGGHLSHGMKINISGRLYTIVHYGVEPDTFVGRLRQGARAREGAPAEDDRLRRLRLSAHGRDGQVPRDRRRGRRAPALRHGALRRARRGGAPPEPGAELRLRHLDDAQDARRPARRLHPLHGGVGAEGRQGDLPGPPGRAARARDRRQGDRFKLAGDGRVPRVPGRRCARTPTRSARASSRAALDVSPAARTRTSCSSTSARPSGRAPTRRTASTRSASPSTRTRSRSTSARRRSPRACASGRPPARCAASTPRTSARSGGSSAPRSRADADIAGAARPLAGALRQEPALSGVPRLLHVREA